MKSVINCIAGESRLNKHSDQARLFMIRHPLGHRIDECGQREGEKHHHGPLHLHLIGDAIFEKCLEYLDPAMVTSELMTMSLREAKLILLSQLSPMASRCS